MISFKNDETSMAEFIPKLERMLEGMKKSPAKYLAIFTICGGRQCFFMENFTSIEKTFEYVVCGPNEWLTIIADSIKLPLYAIVVIHYNDDFELIHRVSGERERVCYTNIWNIVYGHRMFNDLVKQHSLPNISRLITLGIV